MTYLRSIHQPRTYPWTRDTGTEDDRTKATARSTQAQNRHRRIEKEFKILCVPPFALSRNMGMLIASIPSKKVDIGAPLSYSHWCALNRATHYKVQIGENTTLQLWSPSQMNHQPSIGYKYPRLGTYLSERHLGSFSPVSERFVVLSIPVGKVLHVLSQQPHWHPMTSRMLDSIYVRSTTLLLEN